MKPLEQNLLKLLSNKDVTFFIPPFQRNYEWEDEQCEIFWNDVVATTRKNAYGERTEHFFGAVTYYDNGETSFGEPDILILIDGQQRITTTMLFLAALRDSIPDAKARENIDKKYLKNDNATGDNDEYKIKLKQVESDWEAYKRIILGEEPSGRDRGSQVFKNYQFFLAKLADAKKAGPNLLDLVGKGLGSFSVITIELQPRQNPWENPQEIFESMNSIGKPLSLADLVRNYLMFGFDSSQQDAHYKKYWLAIERALPKKLSAFIRDFMQVVGECAYPVASDANHKNLYHEFKALFAKEPAEGILKKLSEYAKVYELVVFDSDSGDKKVNSHLKDFRKLKITTAYSFLLALLWEWRQGGFTDGDIDEILGAFKIYCLRRRLIGGLTTGENKNFPRFVRFIPELRKAAKKSQALFKNLSQGEAMARLPNDDELANELRQMSNFYSFAHCKFYLALMEEALTRSRPNLDEQILQVEHIMPQTLNKAWLEYLGEKDAALHQQYVHSLGNLTLIRHNQQLGQKPFDEKKEVYKNKAGLQIAKTEITDKKAWSIVAIRKRAEWMIKFLLENVLPIPQELRRTNNFRVRAQGEARHLSFTELDLIGEELTFRGDDSISVKVVSDKEVLFEGRKWKLSPLTRELYTRQGKCNKSGAYQGAQYWRHDDTLLAAMM